MIYYCLYFLFLHKHFWILTVTDKSYYFKFLVTKQEYNVLLFVLDNCFYLLQVKIITSYAVKLHRDMQN